jgi:ATP-dependent DNA helicase DinG
MDHPENAQIAGIAPELLEKARTRLEYLYEQVADSWPGFIARPGQYEMMHAALLTFLCARAPEDEDRSGSNLAQLEAGTGTGKTVAYCLAAIVASELLDKTVIVSTATVALQEQLFNKDLPRLAKIIPELRFDILKGRGRYLCESRLEGAIHEEGQDSLLSDALDDPFADERRPAAGDLRDSGEALRWFKKVYQQLHSGQ